MAGSVVDRLLARRNSFPGFANRAIDYVADHPMGLLGRLAARRMGAVREVPPASVVPHSPIRLLIAPVNYSGQAVLWARALERADASISARNMSLAVPGGFSFDTDLEIPIPAYHNSRQWQQAQLDSVLHLTHVLIEAEEPLFGRLFGRDTAREAAALAAAGVSVAFLCHGTDVRLPSRHRQSTPWSPYRDPGLYTDRLERLARSNAAMIAAAGRPVFVSTPDLLADVPAAHWCPVVIDTARWDAEVVQHSGPLRVAHVPSSALVKGTGLIEPMLRELHDEGVIDYRPVVGVASAGMPAIYRDTDVVLDQFRLGSYGVAACEAMAAGRTVIGHVLPEVRATVSRATKRELPIVEATPDTLEAVLRALAADREQLAAHAAAGRSFVAEAHDGRMSARVLREHWLTRSGT